MCFDERGGVVRRADRPRQEFRALEQLQNQHYTRFLPTLKRETIGRNKLEVCVEPLFSKYLFVRLEAGTSNWARIRGRHGVSRLVDFGGAFAALPDTSAETLQHTASLVHKPLLTGGEQVRVLAGPFAGLEGIYQLANEDARAVVLMEFMSKSTKLNFSTEFLREAA
jgi:transcriptional antiterminator RfaH